MEKQMYVILSDTGTWFTRLIQLYTRAKHNHASISFDPTLEEVYSFGRKQPRNPFIGGFVKEDMHGGALFDNATCAVYRCTLTDAQYQAMRASIRQFEQNAHRYKYNLLGLFTIPISYPLARKYAFFCSQFVASLFEHVGVKLTPKCAALTTPTDLASSKKLVLIYEGKIESYCTMESSLLDVG